MFFIVIKESLKNHVFDIDNNKKYFLSVKSS